jgi:hypothetical protein
MEELNFSEIISKYGGKNKLAIKGPFPKCILSSYNTENVDLPEPPRGISYEPEFSVHHKTVERGRFEIEKETHIVDFSQVESFTDPTIANACVEVMTSDGAIGSLSHLTIFHDPEQFSHDLRDMLGNDGIPVVLAGGDLKFRESIQLVEGLLKHLKTKGFVVDRSRADLLGRCARQSTLYRDFVYVKQQQHGAQNYTGIQKIEFPQKPL